MNLSPTSTTLFLVQIGTFFAGVIVITCLSLYISAYPNSPNAGGLSGISIATLIFALISTVATAVLALRQKAGRTIKAWMEGVWCGVATVFWILASAGGIASPANDMRNVTCKVLPDGKEIDDANYKRACQASFAATAFCIVSALLFMATCALLVIFSIQRKVREKKASAVKVGGNYTLAPSPSQYRRAEQAAKDEEEQQEGKEGHSRTSSSNRPEASGATAAELQPLEENRSSIELPENVYRDPVIATSATATATATATTTPNTIAASPSVTSPAPALVAAAPMSSTMTPAQASFHHQQFSSQGNGNPYVTGGDPGHVQYPGYQSNMGGYGYNGNVYDNNSAYLGPQGSGHVHQGSQMSGVSGGGGYGLSTFSHAQYPSASHSQYPSVSHSQYPSATGGSAPGAVYPLMPGAPEFYHQQQQQQQPQDYLNQGSGLNTIVPPSHQQSPSSSGAPYGTMPRPEHF
ncbi:hypothetical protein DFQ27_003452 [Actinomortierella ambigua]|uniref:MARVEL domain-containing protein n=1 Tax=Actinomortierella ambigua TaxID=1343610 RepID=A0A9P6Q4P1_9FUNG|nr:hypothetical protein DFQ27_003452 [Actinomortierella ambigua]